MARRIALCSDALAVLFSGSARKPRVLARFTASANDFPFAANNCCAADSLLTWMATRPALPSAATLSAAGGPAVHDGVPAVTGRVSLMDDESARGASSSSLLELVGPASSRSWPDHETMRRPGLRTGVIDEDDGGLAAHVDAGVIVQQIRARDSVSDEHRGLASIDRRSSRLVR